MRSNPLNRVDYEGRIERSIQVGRGARLKYLIYRQGVESDSDLGFGDWGLRIDIRLVSLTMHI